MNLKRILALTAALILAGLYGGSLILAITGSPNTKNLLMAALFASVVIPALAYGFTIAVRFFSGDHSDLSEPNEKKES